MEKLLATNYDDNSQETSDDNVLMKLKILLETKDKEGVVNALDLNSSTVADGILDDFIGVFTPQELNEIKRRVKIKEDSRGEAAAKFGEEQVVMNKILEENTTDTMVGCRLDNRIDKMTGIFGPEQYLATMISSIETVIKEAVEEDNLKSLERISVFFIDLNGLKAINDLGVNGHDGGDLALKSVGEALNNESLMNWLGKKGIEIIPVHKHGDEFLLSVIDQDGSNNINLKREQFIGVEGEIVKENSVSEYSMEYIMRTLRAKNSVEFMDMDNSKQRTVVENNVGDIPEGFKFELSFSSGHVNLLEVVENSDEDLDDNSLDYWKKITGLAGKMINIADTKMSEDKLKQRAIRRSGNEKARFLEEMYRFRAVEEPERRVTKSTEGGLEGVEMAIKKLKETGVLNEGQLKAVREAITKR